MCKIIILKKKSFQYLIVVFEFFYFGLKNRINEMKNFLINKDRFSARVQGRTVVVRT